MRRRRSARGMAVIAQAAALVAALAGPATVAAATVSFTLQNPSVSTVAYSDLVNFRGTYTCVNDTLTGCPTTTQTHTANFSIRPSGTPTFFNVGTVSTTFAFTSNPAGCASTCSVNFQFTWRSGRIATVTVPPGVYDIGLTTSIGPGQLVMVDGLTITTEATTTTYTGASSGLGNTTLALGGTVLDQDRGIQAGTGIISPDPNLAGTGVVTFGLYDASNTTLVVGPVSANLTSAGLINGSPSLLLPASGGTFQLRTTYAGNPFYLGTADLDTITVTPSNTPPDLSVPAAPVVAEATSPLGAPVDFEVSATDLEDDPDPAPTCSHTSGSTFPLGETTVTCSVVDSGGLNDTDAFAVHVIDSTDPVVAISTSESFGSTGWYNAASNDGTPGVTVDVTTADAVAVVALECTVDGADVGPLKPAGDTFVLVDGQHTVACSATDGSGNADGASATLDVDQTAPANVLLTDGGLVDRGAYPFLFVPDGSTGCTATDALSGVASCHVSGYEEAVGSHTVVATATDVAGNSATATLGYQVVPWTLVGFAKPVEMTGFNALKAGGTAQLKFEVSAGTTQLTSPTVIASVSEEQIACGVEPRKPAGGSGGKKPDDGTTSAAAGGGGGRFTVRWNSPDAAGTCWRVTVRTLDGSSLSAAFRLR